MTRTMKNASSVKYSSAQARLTHETGNPTPFLSTFLGIKKSPQMVDGMRKIVIFAVNKASSILLLYRVTANFFAVNSADTPIKAINSLQIAVLYVQQLDLPVREAIAFLMSNFNFSFVMASPMKMQGKVNNSTLSSPFVHETDIPHIFELLNRLNRDRYVSGI